MNIARRNYIRRWQKFGRKDGGRCPVVAKTEAIGYGTSIQYI
jgi:hypothetical protein